jgi:hypothetical protein
MSQTKSDWNLVLFDELFHLVLVSKESVHWLACNLLFSRHRPRHEVVSLASQKKWGWNLVLIDELFCLVLLSRESVRWLACKPLFSPLRSQAQGGLTCVSDQVRPEPSANWQDLSFGSTFKQIGPLAGLQFTIQSLKRLASRKVFRVLWANKASDWQVSLGNLVVLTELYNFGFWVPFSLDFTKTLGFIRLAHAH